MIGIVGYGEVGRILAEDFAAQGVAVSAFDVAPAAQARAAAAGIAAASAHAAIRDATTVFVCVTAGSALDAARSLVGGLDHAPFVVDVNSVSPATKREAARVVAEAGGGMSRPRRWGVFRPGGCARRCCSAGPASAISCARWRRMGWISRISLARSAGPRP